MPSGLPTARIRRAPESYGRRPCNGRAPERLTHGRQDGSPGTATGGVKSLAGSCDYRPRPRTPWVGAAADNGVTRGLGTTLRTTSASVISFTAQLGRMLPQHSEFVERLLKQRSAVGPTFVSSVQHS